jgi:hypothetical protein
LNTNLDPNENEKPSENIGKGGKKAVGIVLKVVAVLVILAVVGVGGVYLWQRDNINAVLDANKYSTEELQSQIENSQENVQAVLDEYNVTQIRDLTPEEELELCKGNMTPEEAVAIIMGNGTGATSDENSSDNAVSDNSENKQSDGKSDTKSNGKSSAATDEKSAVVQKYVAQMYSIKAKYMGELGSLAQSAKAKYDADKQTVGKTKAVENAVAANLSKAASLESQCDKEVESVLSSMEKELNAIGADTSIVNTIRTEYQNEKSLKKSYYLSLKNK